MLAKSYIPKLPRWKHQNSALAAMDHRNAFALFLDMRCGKSKTVLDEFGQDEAVGLVRNLLVVAPGGVFRTWKEDARKHLSDRLNGITMIECWESGPTAAQMHALKGFMGYSGPRIFLVNIEALSTKTGAAKACKLFMAGGKTTMVVDESAAIKNRNAARTKVCVGLGDMAIKRRILSGLPTPQSPLDIYAQLLFMNEPALALESYDDFQSRYAITQLKPFGPKGRLVKVVVGYQRLEELQARIAPYSFRVRLADCYDLPEKQYIRREVAMTPEQQTAYSQMLNYAVAVLENTERVTATIVLTQMLRLHQILTGVTMSDDGVESEIPENRTAELLDILENTDGKAIIWAAYDANVRRIVKAITDKYGPGSVARFWGGNRDTREHEEHRFKTDPRCRFMVATAAAGGRGRTWVVANTIVYFSNTFSLEHRMQSEDRAQAVDKVESTGIFDLMTPFTVEVRIIDALRGKLDLSRLVVGDEWREWIT